MAEHLEFKLKQKKVGILGLEGLRQADWVLIDANDVIVHIFRPEVREFYGLERMWVDDMSAEIVKVGSDAYTHRQNGKRLIGADQCSCLFLPLVKVVLRLKMR